MSGPTTLRKATERVEAARRSLAACQDRAPQFVDARQVERARRRLAEVETAYAEIVERGSREASAKRAELNQLRALQAMPAMERAKAWVSAGFDPVPSVEAAAELAGVGVDEMRRALGAAVLRRHVVKVGGQWRCTEAGRS